MPAFIAKQPNGLYCRFSTVVDCPTHYNMTEESYIFFCGERSKKEAKETLDKQLKDFELVKESFCPNNMSKEKFKEILKEMGDDTNG